ncbi:MAG: helix-turn-helix transcriptional regulator [Vicinamibacterales bacterium]
MTTLQLLRLERRIGQPALAKLSGVPQPTISMIESRRINPREDELDRLGRALGVSPEVLMREVTPDLSRADGEVVS